jgi:protein-L-isoaspartate(D-aspartate) O-methyltransferase
VRWGEQVQEPWTQQRLRMVSQDLRGRGIRDERVLAAMGEVPRHLFVPQEARHLAYADTPLPIGGGQTISQPYIVALMTEALQLAGGERVLEIGTGSGYQTAVLAALGAEVWTVERSGALSEEAMERLRGMGYASIRFRVGDGTLGWPAEAPFARILATGSLPEIDAQLLSQLRLNGIFVGPIGSRGAQDLVKIVYHGNRSERTCLGGCRFVPLIGAHGWRS